MKKNTRMRYYWAYIYNLWKFKFIKFLYTGRLPFPTRYNKAEILPKEKGTEFIKQLITGNKPIALARLGGSELGAIREYARIQIGIKRSFGDKIMYTMANNAGFFPADDTHLYQYGAFIERLCPSIDVMTVYNQFMEEYIIDVFCENPVLIEPRSSSIIYSEWTEALKGMKVLVIHPYADLIASQYKKREFLFPGTDILPAFDLRVYPAVQTSAGQIDERFSTWFDALEYMMEGISKIDFDIALIGAGAYGLPLAIRIKNELNKKAVQMGGLVQILFGIRGKRWDHSERLNTFYNEHWVRPGEAYTPQNADRVESGCYW